MSNFFTWINVVIILCGGLLIWDDARSDDGVRAYYVGAYDGDTVTVNVPSWPPLFGHELKIRVRGVNTPEVRRAKCWGEVILGYKARKFTRDFMSAGRVALFELSRGTFFRVVARIEVGGEDLGSALLRAELAHEYDYKKGKKSWCGGLPPGP